MLQTNDKICKLYSYIHGAPIIINDNIYNYLPSENLELCNIEFYQKFNKNIDYSKIEDNERQFIFSNIKEIKTKNISRYYFNKYIKYKNKYLKLKNYKL